MVHFYNDTGLDIINWYTTIKKSSLKMIYLDISISANHGKDLQQVLHMISLSLQRDKNTFFEVSVSCTRVNKRLPAVLTDVRSLSSVDPDMCVQVAGLSKVFPTKVAVVGFLSRVNSQMNFQQSWWAESSATHDTQILSCTVWISVNVVMRRVTFRQFLFMLNVFQTNVSQVCLGF